MLLRHFDPDKREMMVVLLKAKKGTMPPSFKTTYIKPVLSKMYEIVKISFSEDGVDAFPRRAKKGHNCCIHGSLESFP